MFGLGPTELIVIAVIVLLIFGAKRLPEIGKGIGGAVREFKNIKKEASLERPAEKSQGEKTPDNTPEATPSLEAKVAGKVLDQVPGVKKVVEVKRKAEQVKKILQ